MYKQLYNNEPVIFDFTNKGNNFVCKNNKDHTVSNISHCTITCKYIRNENDKTFIT